MKSTIKTTGDIQEVSKITDSDQNIVRWSVDLNDWERVLKVITKNPTSYSRIMNMIHGMGYMQ